MRQAIAAIHSNACKTIREAAQQYSVPSSTLGHRLNGRVAKNQAHERTQNLTHAEELELKRWITKLTRLGYPPRHQLVRELAEEIRKHRVREINSEDMELVSYPPLGEGWTRQFLGRHPDLKTAMLKTIEAARVKDTNPEALGKWFQCFKEEIQELNIRPQDMYNVDESGFAIGTTQARQAIINAKIRSRLQVQPGRQEWVTVIECICGDGTAIPPLVIFKGNSLSNNWIPADVADDWKFSCNSKGWTSNIHGMEWLRRCFEPVTVEKASGRTRLLICDGHESHITGAFIAFCMQNNIELMILPPHSSHYTQPLDLALFSPLKAAMAVEIDKVIRVGVMRVIKVEWLSAYIQARVKAFSTLNISAGWSAAGLLPFNPSKVLDRFLPIADNTDNFQPQTPETQHSFPATILNSSPSDAVHLHNGNNALMSMINANEPLNSPAKRWIGQLTKSSERLLTRATILERSMNDMQNALSARKRQASGKRRVIKGQHIMTRPELLDRLLAEETRIAATKKKVVRKGKAVATAVEQEDPTDSDISIEDCIVVGMEPYKA